jgi:L-ascorbate metabolism protein UlaG (beta-lactamase superfamily)
MQRGDTCQTNGAADGSAGGASLRVTWVGHSTLLIEGGGARLLTDPLLRRWAGPLRRYAPPVDMEVVRPVDLVLLSHLHLDHVDRRSLQLLGSSTEMAVPAHAGGLLHSWGFAHVRSVKPGDSFQIGELQIKVVPARHESKRHYFSNEGDPVGYVISAGCTVYFPGDTGPFPEMRQAVGNTDLALLPIWGWGTSVDEDIHLTPLTAAEVAADLRPRVVVPIHWGTYAPPVIAQLRRFDQEQPVRAFERYAAHLAPDSETRILRPGDSTVVGGCR